ncbi:MAG: ABC transporter permease, partial [Acidobacteria bacterium]|nr:ABC transporter permease [Acidobacteriota bacterium]
FVLLMIVMTCLVVSLAPALQLTRMSWRGAVMVLTARTGRTRGLLLATQIAVALALVLSAMLLTRSVTRITAAPTDFALHTTLVATVQLPGDAGTNLRRIVRRGLEDAAARNTERIGLVVARRDAGQLTQYMKGARRSGSETLFLAQVVPLSTGAVDVLALELARGRWYTDGATSEEAVINETLARRLWGEGDAIGQTLELDNGRQAPTVYRIVGISRDAHLTQFGDVDPTLHVSPLSANLMPALLIRNTPGAADRLNAIARAIDPSVRLTTTPLVDLMTPTLGPAKVAAAIAGSLGAMALSLAVIGVFGVFSYLVEERRREIGIRLALGASRAQIRRALFSASRWSLIGGTAAGVALSLLVGAALRGYLYGMSPADPWSVGLVAVVLTIAALGATAIPLRRALRVDPAMALRAE